MENASYFRFKTKYLFSPGFISDISNSVNSCEIHKKRKRIKKIQKKSEHSEKKKWKQKFQNHIKTQEKDVFQFFSMTKICTPPPLPHVERTWFSTFWTRPLLFLTPGYNRILVRRRRYFLFVTAGDNRISGFFSFFLYGP